MHDIEERRNRRNKSPWGSIITGTAFAAVFGLIWLSDMRHWWPLFPMVFFGIMPIINGLRRALSTPSRRKIEKENARQHELENERRVLKAAHEQKGRITVAGAALHADLPMEDAARILERMAKQGHATMNVTPAGTIEYEFPDFLPRP